MRAASKYAERVGIEVWMTLSEKQKAAIRSEVWRENNPDRHTKLKREWYSANSPRLIVSSKNDYYKRTYGITLDDAKERLAAQNGKCLICEKPISGRNVHVDHCHKTGRVRGLLCSGCNIGVGVLEKPNDWLARAMSYLESHQ